jgi:hypothetical protein
MTRDELLANRALLEELNKSGILLMVLGWYSQNGNGKKEAGKPSAGNGNGSILKIRQQGKGKPAGSGKGRKAG